MLGWQADTVYLHGRHYCFSGDSERGFMAREVFYSMRIDTHFLNQRKRRSENRTYWRKTLGWIWIYRENVETEGEHVWRWQLLEQLSAFCCGYELFGLFLVLTLYRKVAYIYIIKKNSSKSNFVKRFECVFIFFIKIKILIILLIYWKKACMILLNSRCND